ncbi:hypothetical protein CUJ90_24400 [Paraburkholderia terricola]|nr:hypothetical protein CUJ90_24400 [Paraburkholderia terricola]
MPGAARHGGARTIARQRLFRRLYAHKTASGRASNRRSALDGETVIIAEMTARRLIAHAARYFLTAS